MPTVLQRTLLGVLTVIVLVALVIGGYALYLVVTYSRISDHEPLETERNVAEILKADTPYTALTYNVGFGAYTPDYTFFLDEGALKDGTKTHGTHGKAVSQESVEATSAGDANLLTQIQPDFALLQEVDTDSDRSFHVNMRTILENALAGYSSTYAVNFHSAWLALPLSDPHGVVNSGILTLADAHIASAERRSYPVDNAFPTKFFDLDRAFEVMRMPVDNGKELVLINSHMSAYDEGGKIRAQQLAMLTSVLTEERNKGNYVVCGGDWNHALADSLNLYPTEEEVPEWVAELSDEDLPEGFSVVKADNLAETPTVRSTDIPYQKGVSYTSTVDGFIVSDNVRARAENIDNAFAFSDHNPVKLTFELAG